MVYEKVHDNLLTFFSTTLPLYLLPVECWQLSSDYQEELQQGQEVWESRAQGAP